MFSERKKGVRGQFDRDSKVALLIKMERESDHFELENWADFVRGHFGSEVAPEMQQHLDQGCEPCSRTARLWRQVVEFATRERKFNPPQSDLRLAKALYSSFLPLAVQPWTLRIAHLLRQGQPAPVGVRGLGPSSHHYLFQGGGGAAGSSIGEQTRARLGLYGGAGFRPRAPGAAL